MNFEPLRRVFQPLFGLERRQTIARFLYAILVSSMTVISLMILLRLWETRTLQSMAVWMMVCFLASELILVFVLKWGYVDVAALGLVSVSWLLVTYQAWASDGIRDVSIFIYILIIFIAALLTDWIVAALVSALTVAAIWWFAIAEALGMRSMHLDAPLVMAGDLTAIFVLLVIFVYLVVNNVRHALDAVREGEEKFRKIFHVSPVAISITSMGDGRLLDANEAYFKLLGRERHSALGKTTVELGFWSSETERTRFVTKLLECRSLNNPAYTFRSKTGEERITLAFHELIEGENEPAILSMFHDITDQRRFQQALQASEEKYRNFVEQSMEGIWLVEFDEPIPTDLPPAQQVHLIYQRGYVAQCNDVLAQMYGYSSSTDICGARLSDLDTEQTLDPLNGQSLLQLVQDDYRSANRATREVRRNGETVYFLHNSVGVIKGGYLVGLWSTRLDISAVKKVEDALRRSEARMRALLNAIPDMIFELKRDGTILQFIPSSTNEPLIPPEQFLGKTIGDLFPALKDRTQFAIERALDSGHVHAFEYDLDQDGGRTFEARLTPLGSETVLAMVRDVSLQKWIEVEREQLIAELEAKNAELERFTYTVSHDLKSPLITIRGFLGFLREDSHNGNFVRLDSDIQRISDATEKMQRLLNDLLELSRVGRLVSKPVAISLNELVADALDLLHGQLSQGGIAVRVADGLPTVYGDRQRLVEVIQNLVDNASKFMGNQPAPRIEIGQRGMRNDMPVVYVRDNGIGIAPEFHETIFGLFNKLDPRSGGTGIGLALVRRIIEFHHGSIWVESEPGGGTTFLFTLPTTPPEGA